MARNSYMESEDTVQCLFFSSSQNSDAGYWEQMCGRVNETIKALSNDYIWHRDEFSVYLPVDNREKGDDRSGMISTTCFGDNIEDEWFIVHLVMEITKHYKELIVQITDNDGDFLLIEAADCLHSWANPETTENRVYIYQNHIHLIGPDVVDTNSELSVKDAIQFVIDSTIQTEASEIQRVIQNRIGNYPEKIKESIHRAVLKLPLDLATLLTLKPSLISPIVSTYCNHDVIDAKACKNISFEDCVPTKVKFTKCLYAMLINSKLVKNNKYAFQNENDKTINLGLKLTCGYEMIRGRLYQDIFSSKEYNKFVKSLADNGYFKGNIKGSKDYNQLLENAKEFFLRMECPINSHVSNIMSNIMQTDEFYVLKDTLKNKSGSDPELVDDNEDWLNIHPEQLNDLLNSRYGKKSRLKNDDIITGQTITSELSNFFKQTSDFEGIEPKDSDATNDSLIEFDSDEFVNSIQKMLKMTSDNPNMNGQSDFSDDTEDDATQDEIDDWDRELKCKLHIDTNDSKPSSKTILHNMIQSIKEEGGSSGPSSNILKTIGISKSDILDSDDDEV